MSTSRENNHNDEEDGNGNGNGVHSQFRALVLSDAERASMELLKEVKDRFPDKLYILTKFREHLREFTRRIIDVQSLGVEVKKLFKGHDDLILKYNAFVPDCYRINLNNNDKDDDSGGGGGDDDDDSVIIKDDDGGGGGVRKLVTAIELVNKVKIRFRSEERVYEEFLGMLMRVREEEEGFLLNELKKKVAGLFGNNNKHGDLLEEFERYITECSREQNKHMMMTRSVHVHELDLSKCKQVSPSYWLLPDNHMSGDDDDDAQVLNHSLVCTSAYSEGTTSFGQRLRTPEEEILFNCEDDRFELDMLLERLNSAAKSIIKMLMNKTEVNKGDLSVMDLRCIERLYGDHGPEVIETLRTTPETALPVILKTLNKKRENLLECRSDFSKVWSHICSINHCKLQQKQKNSKGADSVADDQFKETRENEENKDASLDPSGFEQPILLNSEVQLSVTN